MTTVPETDDESEDEGTVNLPKRPESTARTVTADDYEVGESSSHKVMDVKWFDSDSNVSDCGWVPSTLKPNKRLVPKEYTRNSKGKVVALCTEGIFGIIYR